MFDGFKHAVIFLTRLPVKLPGKPKPLAASAPFFPTVGLVVGSILGALFAALTLLGIPSLPASIAVLAAAALLTGALHEDGLADCADALGPHDRQRRLEVMRDSRLGTFGALALILVVLARLGGLAALWDPWMQFAVLVSLGAASRVPMVVLMAWLPPIRGDGLSAKAGRPELASCLIAVAVAVGTAVLLLPPAMALAILGATAAATLIWGLVARRVFGGQTGDVLGASQQLAEALSLLVLTAVL